MGNSAKRDVRKAERAERARKAMMLRRDELSYEAIGIELGVTKGQAWKLVHGYIEAIPKEAAQKVRRLELLRLEREARRNEAAYKALLPRIKEGDIDAIRTSVFITRSNIRIFERRAAYLGLDEPKVIENKGDVFVPTSLGPAVQIILSGEDHATDQKG